MLDRTVPAVAARWAERLFFRVPRLRSRPVPPDGRSVSVEFDGLRLAGQVWGAGPTVYLVPGFGGEIGQLAGFVQPFTARGLRVVAFDWPAHGRTRAGTTGGQYVNSQDLVNSLHAIATAYGPARAIIAHSMGAGAAANAVRDGLPTGRLALIAPGASIQTAARPFADALGMREPAYRRLLAEVERALGHPVRSYEVTEIGRIARTPPTLVVHDQHDPLVPFTDGESIAHAWPKARLVTTTGLGHNRILGDPGVIEKVVDFVAAA
ncbi:hypothetical protein Val02_51070 [Virgisporangium aliadipatigenens]|uniref:Alpha/beta hydrolase n=1 Tax=Virgisporangium aliadipatigenens TaxID=741659 RepID=A0A8J4DSJ0_9ACTN|nr:hypothetical protein Val02_51070 [Virgisporangium aliadipatigenens]